MKKKGSHSIFCCFCEETRPRRTTRDTHSLKGNMHSKHESKEHKIDTNSNIKSIDKNSINSILAPSKHNNNNSMNYPNNNGSIKKIKDYSNYSSVKKSKVNDKKSNATCSTVNYNVKQLMDKNKLTKQDLNTSLKKRNNSICIQQYNYYTHNDKMQNNNNYINNIPKNIPNNNFNTISNTNPKKEIIEPYLNQNDKSSRLTKISNNSIRINENICNDMNEIMNNSKRIKGLSEKSIVKSKTIFELEDRLSNVQLDKQNKSNQNKSITNIIEKSSNKIPKGEEIINNNNNNINILNDTKSIVNNVNESINNTKNEYNKINDIFSKFSEIDKNLDENFDSVNDNKNDYSNNDLNVILTPKKTKTQMHTVNNIEEKIKKAYIKCEQNINNKNIDNKINTENVLFSNNNNNNIISNPINAIDMNKKEDKQEIELEINITKREDSKKNIINEINNDETINNSNDDINSDINNNNKDILYSKTMKYQKSKRSFMSVDEENEEKLNNNSLDIQLNYLTEFYTALPQENKSILMTDLKNGNNIENKDEKHSKIKSNREEKENEEEDNEKEELEDEVGSIDEFHNANDNRSILSSYIFNSVHISENKSITQSINTRSEFRDSDSNFNDIVSSRGGFIPSRINSKEFEFRLDKGTNFAPVTKESNKNMYANPNINMFLNSQINYSIKKVKEKINDKDILIKKNSDNINNVKNKIKNIEEANKQYEKWIDKMAEENERLRLFLNFLMTNN